MRARGAVVSERERAVECAAGFFREASRDAEAAADDVEESAPDLARMLRAVSVGLAVTARRLRGAVEFAAERH